LQSEIDTDAISRVIIKKADDLHAAVVVLAKRKQPKLKDFFLGSVCAHTLAHCKKPVLVIH